MSTAGCRRLWALVQGLPREAAVWREDISGWTQEHELAATSIEVGDMWGRLIYRALHGLMIGKQPKKVPDPVVIEHPGRAKRGSVKPEITTDPREISAFFAHRNK